MRKQEKILLWGSNIWFLADGMLGPLFAVFIQKIGGSIFDISWAWATYLVVKGFLSILIGKLSDSKWSKEKLMILGYSLNAFFTFSYIFVSTPMQLFLVQIGLGIAVAMATPTWQALYSKYEEKGKGGSEWGLVDGDADIIMGVSMIIGGYLVTMFSFKLLFFVMGTIQVIATVYQAKILKKPRSKKV